MKRTYSKMSIECLAFLPASDILTGSLTKTKIKVNKVEVEEFDAGFSIGPDNQDFQDISFD